MTESQAQAAQHGYRRVVGEQRRLARHQLGFDMLIGGGIMKQTTKSLSRWEE